MTHIRRAVDLFASQKEFADAVGVPSSFVSQWISKHRKVPPAHCKKIEAITNGSVTAEQLRPDIFERPAA